MCLQLVNLPRSATERPFSRAAAIPMSPQPGLPSRQQQQQGAVPPAPAPPAVDATLRAGLARVMMQHWGHAEFRPLQAEAVAATLGGKDVLLILPTGGGKSLAFQLAPLYRNQFTVVVTPLLALARDQARIAGGGLPVNGCVERGIEAAAWSSETPEHVKARLERELLADLEDGSLSLLYTTPESLQMERLREVLKAAHSCGRLCSFAIDEAHAVSEWGHDFRPSYLTLGQLRGDFPGVPLIAATATATAAVRRSIAGALGLRAPLLLQGSFNRPNLCYEVRHKELVGDGSREAALQRQLLPGAAPPLVCELTPHAGRATQPGTGAPSSSPCPRRGQCGIVYARLRATCDWLAAALGEAEVECAAYHAGKDSQQRNKIQSGWMDGDYEIVCATIAFGMGIDKGDVRFVEPRCRRRALLAHFGEQRSGGCSAQRGEGVCDYCRDPKRVLHCLAVLDGKLEAAAEAEAEAAAAAAAAAAAGAAGGSEGQGAAGGDPFDRCNAGSGDERRRGKQGRGAGSPGSGSCGEGSCGEGSDREGGGDPAPAAAVGPFSTARALEQQRRPPAGRRLAAWTAPRLQAAPAAGGGSLPARPGGVSRVTAAARGLEPGAANRGAGPACGAGAGAEPARQPLRPLLPNRLKRPLATAAAGAAPKQQQQQQGGQAAGQAGEQPSSPVGAAGPGGPSAAGNAAATAPVLGGSGSPLAGTAARTAPAATAAAGDGSATGAGGGGGGRRPVFRAFKPPRRVAQA
ncbi:hypothetical protein CHLNCDRAFT_55365 [Chlorella variabilis]|uniref:DNA 3'-5' helicase n=1 Tax=Chlorella variabilis TaxID=554065 RepID=E1ZSV8_CHLVA|nr:hypothetical protein CHLNCDRAFT_55365 [Chlorella variabilis]EFN51104.1 hypothetical protein CHLNCDRAFT_55365 [Chlorella variabilis]|eukprot:XP_005843206.1 hypothetical protein CHLNCDRAFT_55365 [Chlorella variabilis]